MINDNDLLKYDENYIVVEPKKRTKTRPAKRRRGYINPKTPPKIRAKAKPRINHKPIYDALKYWRIVRKWVIVNNPEISTMDLELFLMIYSEKPFNRDSFNEFVSTMTWDKSRLSNLIKNGWVDVFRDGGIKGSMSKLYCLSRKGKLLVTSIYKKLSLEEEIPTNPQISPMFKAKEVSYYDKIYRSAIKRMNEKIKEKKAENSAL